MNLQEIKEQKQMVHGESIILAEQITNKLDVINGLKKGQVSSARKGEGIHFVETNSQLEKEEEELKLMQKQLEKIADQLLSIENKALEEIDRCKEIREAKFGNLKAKAEKLKKAQSELIHGLNEVHGIHEEIQKINEYMDYVNRELSKENQSISIESGYDRRVTSQFIRSLLIPQIRGVRM